MAGELAGALTLDRRDPIKRGPRTGTERLLSHHADDVAVGRELSETLETAFSLSSKPYVCGMRTPTPIGSALLVTLCATSLTVGVGAVSASASAESSQALASTWSAPAPATTPMSPSHLAVLDATVSEALRTSSEGTAGAWVGVWSPDAGVAVRAYGKSALPNTPARLVDHNRMGSITKTVTATAVLEQVAKGTMKLSDTVRRLDPALARRFPAIATLTVDQLLGMRSGLPDYANEPEGVLKMIAAQPKRNFTPKQLIGIGLAANVLQPAGTDGYSTTNYMILGQLLSKVTGQSPEQVINDVFVQAGMTQSGLPNPGNSAPWPRSHGYIGNAGAEDLMAFGVPNNLAGTDVTNWSLSWGRAGGGAYTTIRDLGRWGALGLGTALLPKALGDQRIAVAQKSGIGYGWGIFVDPEGWISHTGQVLGWEASVEQNIRTGEVIAVMVNSTSGLSDITGAVDRALGSIS